MAIISFETIRGFISSHLIEVLESLPDYQSASSWYSTAKQKVFVFGSGLSHTNGPYEPYSEQVGRLVRVERL